MRAIKLNQGLRIFGQLRNTEFVWLRVRAKLSYPIWVKVRNRIQSVVCSMFSNPRKYPMKSVRNIILTDVANQTWNKVYIGLAAVDYVDDRDNILYNIHFLELTHIPNHTCDIIFDQVSDDIQ